ncbi:magnesium transporter [Catenovulum maritimum]|uniref:Magnesium transporter n=1 Tax=Catenovulum maritimum TaxID=1513271 RepID=A0A0J8JJA4_9ALTE|nr:magnesium transporter [Catenovulum maritimum]KMT64516.1 magnesium transporter [Catenovulum maritimum]
MADELPQLIEEVVAAEQAENDSASTIEDLIASQDVEEIALLLESLPLDQRLKVWVNVPNRKKLDVLVQMRADPREILIAETDESNWTRIFEDIDAEDLLELADSLPRELLENALSVMDKQQRQYFQNANQYEDEQIGHWMCQDVLVLPSNAKVRDGMRIARREIAVHTDTIFLINRNGQFSEAVKIINLLSSPEHIPLSDIAEETIPTIVVTADCSSSATNVLKSGFAALPVVDEQGKLMGKVDVTTAGDLLQEYYEYQLMASAGMDEDEDLFAPVKKSAKNRALWLGINLLTAFLASWFIGLFEATLQEVVALAVLMPVVASMGGIAGSQTLTLIIRGLALDQVNSANCRALLIKELSVGALNGIVWAIVIGIVAYLWFDSSLIGLVIAVAILMNILSAALAGVIIPVILDKAKLDPALSGSVILTTVTDIVGFVAFLGLGTIFLL